MQINLRNTLYQIGLSSTALCLIGVCMLPAAFQHIGTLCKVGIAAFCNASHAAAKLLHARQLSFAHFGTADASSGATRRTQSGARCADAAAPLQGACVAADAALKCDLELLVHPVNFSAESFFFAEGSKSCCCCMSLALAHQHSFAVLANNVYSITFQQKSDL